MGDRLNGKVAVVTGASSGIGEATVRALAVEGSAVVAGARRKERLDELVERVSRDGGKAFADAIVYAVTQPWRVSVNEILIRPTQQPV